MKIFICLLAAVAVLAGCDGTDVVGVDGSSQARPAPPPEEATMMPMCSALYRAGGTHDPSSPGYDPTVADTALMHVPHTFAWSVRDPHGLCDPPLFRHSLDGAEFSVWSADTTAVVDGLTDGPHEIAVQPGCPVVRGIEAGFAFVVNFDPDSEIVDPLEPSGTLTVSDGDTLWVRVSAHDKEELEGVGGGIAEIAMEMDGEVISFDGPDMAVWWWSSNADPAGGHYIPSVSSPHGGNILHYIRVYARDVDGRWEEPSGAEEDREVYWFRYNYPPVVHITYPAEGDTVGSDFAVMWDGYDPDSDEISFQYVLDPWLNSYSMTDEHYADYYGIGPGSHEFRIRAQDGSGCWSATWSIIDFYVE